MLTITFGNDGRTWYGRKRYKVRLENVDAGQLTMSHISVKESQAIMIRIIENEIMEGREFRIVNNTDLR